MFFFGTLVIIVLILSILGFILIRLTRGGRTNSIGHGRRHGGRPYAGGEHHAHGPGLVESIVMTAVMLYSARYAMNFMADQWHYPNILAIRNAIQFFQAGGHHHGLIESFFFGVFLLMYSKTPNWLKLCGWGICALSVIVGFAFWTHGPAEFWSRFVEDWRVMMGK
ncbi:MAG: hypothetical protein HYV33_02010 [Candidatus Kerfeldbacteria bacterium]|nr:hypothetical protein [Candidatus Kerfeldbacteria bacterium]